jgi:diguanylate cyclase (GGDEF)-like protein/putative nucleotidyltransferase with HDIG domain
MAVVTNTEQGSPLATPFVNAVIIAGATVVAHSIHQLFAAPVGAQWFILVALTLLTGSFTIAMSSLSVRVSVSETFVFASVLLFGTAAGTVTVVLETLVMSFWLRPHSRAPQRVLFNAAAPAVAIWVSGTVFYWFSGISPFLRHPTPLPVLFLPLAVFTTLYFLLNTWLVAFAVAFHKNRSPLQIWWPQFTWVSINYFSGASVAALIVTYSHKIDISTLLIIVPLLVISYLTFRTAMGRVDDTTRHLGQLNDLYLSTIETLAMAIDAKDQITHGHIRRVQTYAVGLARRIGVVDDQLIRAIEAAALLHDMGKLAVPEYILNKPGKLTPAEFEKMKLHASVGADILSAIDFPYPVVPIVRHHHEQWSGGGYPDGLSGTDIPIGARILSVVDCFDALTSDRPYRPRLSDEAALNILTERRGSMYDPLIVDTFIKVYKQIAPIAVPLGPARAALNEITSSTLSNPIPTTPSFGLDDITASGDEMLTLYEIAGALAGKVSVAERADAIAKHIRRLVPFSLLVLYVYDPETDDLEARHAIGEAAPLVKGMRISIGQRLSGWVGANRQTIMNSDPVLDLGEMARAVTPRLRNCLSSPLILNGELVGVLTLYSAGRESFTEDHRRIIEVVANQTGQTFKHDFETEVPVGRDLLTLLPDLSQLETLASTDIHHCMTDSPLTLMMIDVVGLEQINKEHGRAAGDEVLRHVARIIRFEVHVPDILFRYRGNEFVALLHSSDSATIEAVSHRIVDNCRQNQLVLRSGIVLNLDLAVSCIHGPQNGCSLHELLSAARASVPARIEGSTGPSVH